MSTREAARKPRTFSEMFNAIASGAESWDTGSDNDSRDGMGGMDGLSLSHTPEIENAKTTEAFKAATDKKAVQKPLADAVSNPVDDTGPVTLQEPGARAVVERPSSIPRVSRRRG